MILRETGIRRRALAAHALLNIPVMNKLLTLALSLPLVACVVGADSPTSGGDGTPGPGPGGDPSSSADHITTDTTWTGTVDVTKALTVDPGVTLTITAGTTVRFATGKGINVAGIVDVQGMKGSPVQLSPATAGGHYNGFLVSTNGELKMTYGVQVGGGISVNGGKLTVTDTSMSQAFGDFLVVGSGTVDVSYSSIGLAAGATDTTHCDMHFSAQNGSSIKVTHSNISTSDFGVMLYGGPGVDLTYNNWFSNTTDVDASPGAGADLSYGWFEKTPPSSSTLIYNNRATSRLPVGVAGPR